ncbi:MAG TPA: hypothetical protein VHZ24_12515 [Pirellulales bacterium]|jgi:hypothetical protein|nr:hypothetical protein [Pirellulales bacterium]
MLRLETMSRQSSLATKLTYWINHRLNILFRGRHGVGKTAIVQKAFERAGLRWRRLSALPFKPEQIFENPSVEALFFDDLERMPKRFRSIVVDLVRNGSERLPNLKVVWAAVSVADDEFEEFDQETVEPFDVTVDVPFRLHLRTSRKSSMRRSPRRLWRGGTGYPKRRGAGFRRGRWRRRWGCLRRSAKVSWELGWIPSLQEIRRSKRQSIHPAPGATGQHDVELGMHLKCTAFHKMHRIRRNLGKFRLSQVTLK